MTSFGYISARSFKRNPFKQPENVDESSQMWDATTVQEKEFLTYFYLNRLHEQLRLEGLSATEAKRLDFDYQARLDAYSAEDHKKKSAAAEPSAEEKEAEEKKRAATGRLANTINWAAYEASYAFVALLSSKLDRYNTDPKKRFDIVDVMNAVVLEDPMPSFTTLKALMEFRLTVKDM
ncbi:Hypothetical protein POVN_LOCUS121 [uncultured virus]|nr:Hypothetical protein POVN_LOCUS121 [uncultured virus]